MGQRFHEAAVLPREHLGNAGRRVGQELAVANDAQPAVALGHQHVAAGQEGDRPGMNEAVGYGRHAIVVVHGLHDVAGRDLGASEGRADDGGPSGQDAAREARGSAAARIETSSQIQRKTHSRSGSLRVRPRLTTIVGAYLAAVAGWQPGALEDRRALPESGATKVGRAGGSRPAGPRRRDGPLVLRNPPPFG